MVDTQKSEAESMRRARFQRRRTIRTWVKRTLIALTIVFVIGAVALSMMPKPVPVDVAVAEVGAVRVSVVEDGKTRVINRFVLSTTVTGNLSRIALRPGDPVKEGAVLARIAPATPPLLDARTKAEARARLAAAVAGARQAEAQLARARAGNEHAKQEAARAKNLYEGDAISVAQADDARLAAVSAAEEMRAAEFAAKVADKQVASARAALAFLKGEQDGDSLELTAPVTGHVLRVLRRDEEGLVQAGTPLIEVGDLDTMELVVDVLTADAVRIKPGALARVVRWGGESVLAASVVRVEPSAFTRVSALGVEEQRVNVVLRLTSPREQWQKLGDGFRVEADIELWSGEVLHVPASAVFRTGDEWQVYVLDDAVAHARRVDIGHRTDTVVEIKGGLQPGERVVSHPGDRVHDGVDVAVRQRH